jgi:hypothetical protein
MLGNDIIDLDDPDADVATFSPRWSSRVLTAGEAEAVAAATDADRMLWRIWAAKEAAYKWARQIDERAIFSPPAFEVTFAPRPVRAARDLLQGHVDWQGERVSLFLEEGARWLHAWVDDAPFGAGPPRLGIAALPPALRCIADGPSRFVRRCVTRDAMAGPLRHASRFHELELEIVRHGRIPQLRSGRGRESASLSLSHHGRFVAWAWRPLRDAARVGSTAPTSAAAPTSNDSLSGVFV